MPNKLDQIIDAKRVEIAERKTTQPLDPEKVLAKAPVVPRFADALLASPMGLIAEVKRKSPSAGPIREPFDPVAIAACYRDAGAQAISCLMDFPFFGGGAEDFPSG